MFTNLLRKAVLYIKEVQEMALFGIMTDSVLFRILNGTPLFYAMFPFIGILLATLSLINGFELARANNQNFDKWFNLGVSILCTVLANISLYGSVLAAYYEFTFAASSWFFFSSVVLASFQQLVMLGLNAYRAYESPKDSVQRMHYVQAALNNLFVLGLLSAITGAVIFVMLTPVAPAVGSVLALTSVAFIGVNIFWRMLPSTWKRAIKEVIYLGKPVIQQEDKQDTVQTPEPVKSIANKDEKHYKPIFTSYDYSARVQSMKLQVAEHYLVKEIATKIKTLRNDPLFNIKERCQQKVELLGKLSKALMEHKSISKLEFLTNYPLAFQNFWAEKGEVEQLFDASLLFLTKHENHVKSQVVSVPPAQQLAP